MAGPKIIQGNLAVDDRGLLRFVNEFDFSGVKRFYQVENHNTEVIRAFHGHRKEEKYIYVTSGTALICAVPLDDVNKPSKKANVEKFIISAEKPCVLHIPASYANGFKFLTDNGKIIFFSTKSLTDSEQNDDFRYPYDYWGKEIWEIKNR